jgi:hypothetical protein
MLAILHPDAIPVRRTADVSNATASSMTTQALPAHASRPRTAHAAPPRHLRAVPEPSRYARVLDLQRAAGNHAVTALLTPAVQRVKPGWTGADASGDGWNVTDRLVKGTQIRRVPVEGLKLGNQEDFASYGDEREMTTESAAGRAIVLFSDALDAKAPVDVMLHFHGYDFRKGVDPHAGWRQDKDVHTVRDVDQDRIEQQMDAAKATQTIAVLPQGIGKSSFGKMPWNDYVSEVLGVVATMGFPQIPKAPANWRLVMSAHSGGGFTVTPALAYDKKHKRFVNEPANLTEIVLFEALHGDAPDVVATWAEVHMSRVRDADDAHRAEALAACPRLRAYYSAAGSYVHKYTTLANRIKGWLDANEPKLGPALRAQLAARFEVRELQGTVHETVVRGLGDDPAAGPIADALRAVDHPDAPSQLLDKGKATWKKAKVAKPKGTTPKTATPKTATPKASPPASPTQAVPSTPKKKAKRRTPGEIPAGAIRAGRLGKFGTTEDETAFRKTVYEKQLKEVVNRGKEFFPGLSKEELGSVDGAPIHKNAEADANALLAAARADLNRERAAGNAAALACTDVGVNNAYRSLEHDFSAWQAAFKTVYKRTAKARAKTADGPLSDAAADIMVNDLIDSKAVPGFSNHTRGLAIDFSTTQDDQTLGPAHKQDPQWKDSWFHHWLKEHAATHHFQPYTKEYWHWDHETAPNGPTPDAQHPDASKAATDTPSAPPAAPAPAPKAKAPAKPKDEGGAATKLAPLPASASVTVSWGKRARQDVVAASSLDVIRDVLRASGLSKATITSTARTAEDQARAMYQNLVGSGKGQGVKAQHVLYGPAGDAVIDTFVELRDKGLDAAAIQDGMRAKIEELGPAKVSRHCADPSKLNVIDVGPNSLGGADAQAAFVAAAQQEEGGRVSKFIPYPKDPGDHFEIPPT